MRELIGLAGAIGLPWLAGTLAARLLHRRGWIACAGYGWFFGVIAIVLVLRALDLAGVRWTLASVGVPMLLLACMLAAGVRRVTLAGGMRRVTLPGGMRRVTLPGGMRRVAPADRMASPAGAEVGDLPPALRALYWACFALIALRIGDVALEVALRPLLPWDAWSQWSTKARVWFEFGRLAPFVTSQEWFATTDPMRFVDMHPGYPATVPLLQVWTNLWLGRWDESLMNAPWLVTMVALGMAFHAQLRRAGVDAAKAMLFTYLLLSLPFLDIHVALAGTADIFVAATYGLAAIALWQWIRERRPDDLVAAAAMAALCVSVKVEGALWAATLIPPFVVALHRRIGLLLVVAIAVAALGYLAFGPAEVMVLGYRLKTRFDNVSLPLAQHLFIMDNWHLFWYGALAVIACRWRRLLGRELLPLTVNVAGAFGLVVVIYFFSSAAGGVDDESLVNRLPLQMIVAFAFYLALLLERPASPRSIQPQTNAADAYT